MGKRRNRYGAIPTTYNKVRYRSRLEARWACVFDLLKIPHAYESIELQGYIPDFICEFGKTTILVECKPIAVAGEFRQPQVKIAKSGWVGPAIIVGSALYLHQDDDLPEITARGTLAAGAEGWSRVGRTAWPAPWGVCPFDEDFYSCWAESGNITQWKAP